MTIYIVNRDRMTFQTVTGAPASDAAAPASAERAGGAPVTTLCIRCHQAPWVGDRTHMCEACIEIMANIKQDDGDPVDE